MTDEATIPATATQRQPDATAAPPRRRGRKPAVRDANGPDAESADQPTTGKVVGAVVGAIKILRCLAETAEPQGVSRIAKTTDLNTSTTFNILRTLLMHDFVQFDRHSKTYSLSLGIMEIARAATAMSGDIGAIRPQMEAVANQHGVTLTLWQPIAADRKLLISTTQPRNAMRIQMAIGQRLPLLVGSTGRLFAAFGTLSPDEIRQQFDRIRWQKPLSFDEFSAQVEAAREHGWALDDGNFAAGTVLISVPVLGSDGRAILAITANMFAGQFDPRQIAPIVEDLQALARSIGRIAPL